MPHEAFVELVAPLMPTTFNVDVIETVVVVEFEANKVIVLMPADEKVTLGLTAFEVAGEPPENVHV